MFNEFKILRFLNYSMEEVNYFEDAHFMQVELKNSSFDISGVEKIRVIGADSMNDLYTSRRPRIGDRIREVITFEYVE